MTAASSVPAFGPHAHEPAGTAGHPLIDIGAVGRAQPSRVVDIERHALRAFAMAIGETVAVSTDVDAERRAGHPDLPVPPTFLFGLNLGRGASDFVWLEELGVDMRTVLHGGQGFRYHRLVHAGDTVQLSPRISDIYARKGGALQFVVRDTSVKLVDGSPIADLRETLVVRVDAS